MRWTKLILLIFMISCLFSCGVKQDYSFNEKLFNVRSYDLILPHGDYLLNAISFVFNKAGRDSVIFLDPASQSFVLADMGKQKILKTLKYDKEGPNFTDFPIFDLRWFNGRLFVLSKLFFTVYDEKGQVINRVSLSDQSVLAPYFYYSFDIIDDEHILLATTAKSAVYSGYYPAPEEDFIFVRLNWNNGSLHPLSISSPRNAYVSDSTRGFYNNFAAHTGIYTEDTIFYNFAFASTIYKSDLKGLNQKSFAAKPTYTDAARKTIAANPTVRESSNYVYSEQPNFTKFMYDEVTGWFARIHGQIKGKEQPKNEKYLMVFDNNMHLMFETPIAFNTLSDSRANVFTNGKVYLLKNNPTTEDAYHFTVYDFNQ